MEKFTTLKRFTIDETSKILNVDKNTLRNWEKNEFLVPERTLGSHRRYTIKQINNFVNKNTKFMINLLKYNHNNSDKNIYDLEFFILFENNFYIKNLIPVNFFIDEDEIINLIINTKRNNKNEYEQSVVKITNYILTHEKTELLHENDIKYNTKIEIINKLQNIILDKIIDNINVEQEISFNDFDFKRLDFINDREVNIIANKNTINKHILKEELNQTNLEIEQEYDFDLYSYNDFDYKSIKIFSSNKIEDDTMIILPKLSSTEAFLGIKNFEYHNKKHYINYIFEIFNYYNIFKLKISKSQRYYNGYNDTKNYIENKLINHSDDYKEGLIEALSEYNIENKKKEG